MIVRLQAGSSKMEAQVQRKGDLLLVTIGDRTTQLSIWKSESPRFLLGDGDTLRRGYAVRSQDDIFLHIGGRAYRIKELSEDNVADDDSHSSDLSVVAPMPGTVIKVLVKEGDVVTRRQSLVIVEAMKMENEVRAPADAIVKKVMVETGEKVGFGQHLVELAPPETVIESSASH